MYVQYFTVPPYYEQGRQAQHATTDLEILDFSTSSSSRDVETSSRSRTKTETVSIQTVRVEARGGAERRFHFSYDVSSLSHISHHAY